mgnify:CR=1 FL=1
MPSDDEQYSFVVNEYSDMGLPGCVGSVDCVHIGWDQCPSQYFHIYTGKEDVPSIAYNEVICTSQKFIPAVSPGHPGARNDKHIVRTDFAVLNLLQWVATLKRMECSSKQAEQETINHFIPYLRWWISSLAMSCIFFKSGLASSQLVCLSLFAKTLKESLVF